MEWLKAPVWRKTRDKKRAKKHHTANFSSGHVQIQDYHLTRTGLRGRKRWCCVCALLLLALTALANLVLTCLILSILRFTPSGLPYLVFGPQGEVVFTQSAVLSRVHVADNVHGYSGYNLNIASINDVLMSAGPQRLSREGNMIYNSSQITVQPFEVNFKPFSSLKLFNADKTMEILSLNKSLAHFPMLKKATNLKTRSITSEKMKATGHNFRVSGNYVSTLGDRGTRLSSERVAIMGNTALNIASSESGEMVIKGEVTLQYPSFNSINETDLSISDAFTGYHLCACSSNWKLFRVPANALGCAGASEVINPCL